MKRSKILKLPMRTILAGVVGAACGLTAISTSATIVNSRHDLRSTLGLGANGEICVVCHTPHDANGNNGTDPAPAANAPLWNRTLSAVTDYTMYSANGSGTIDGAEDLQPTGASRLCLGCHDGTVGLDQYGGGANTGTPVIDPANAFYVGTDLRGQHPISIVYDPVADPGLHPATNGITIGGYDPGGGGAVNPTRTGTIDSLMLQATKVQCSSCHDVHNTFVATSTAMLRISLAGSALCLTCHNK